MKYGIITFHNTLNCGAALQAYALCRFLRNNGVDCDILDYRCKSITERELKFKKSSNIIKTAVNYTLVWPKQKKMNEDFLSIMRKEKMLSKNVYTPENIREANEDYDGFITGSDQVWNLNITGEDYNFFLKFVEDDKRKIAFSASTGEKWDLNNNFKVKELLGRYDSLSLREKSDCDFIKNSFYLDAKHVCDPTMLLSADEWAAIAITPNEKNYVLLYNPESGIEKVARVYAEKYNKKLIWIGTGKVKLGSHGAKTVKPEEWIGYFINASAVFSDSYHGLLFSLYFNKPVWTVYNGMRSNRQASLYEKLDIYNCIYSEENSFEKTIDYSQCNLKIEEFREESISFLMNAVKAGEKK